MLFKKVGARFTLGFLILFTVLYWNNPYFGYTKQLKKEFRKRQQKVSKEEVILVENDVKDLNISNPDFDHEYAKLPVHKTEENLDMDPMAEKTFPTEDEEVDYVIFCVQKNPNDQPVVFKPTHLCAFESSARKNPQKQVRVVIEKGAKWNFQHTYMDQLKNLKFEIMDLNVVMEETPAKDFWHSEGLNKNKNIIYHKSDLVRLALIHKFGGIYQDTDIISLKPWPKDLKNFVATEAKHRISNGIFHMEKGSPLLSDCMTVAAQRGTTKLWGCNGPQLITMVIKKFYCKDKPNSRIESWNCPSLNILEPKYVHPYQWTEIRALIKAHTPMQEVYEKLKEAYVIHMFGHHLFKRYMEIAPGTPLYEIMKENCPSTFDNFETLF